MRAQRLKQRLIGELASAAGSWYIERPRCDDVASTGARDCNLEYEGDMNLDEGL